MKLKNAVYRLQISALVPEIFKYKISVKYATEMADDIKHSTQYYIRYINRAILAIITIRNFKHFNAKDFQTDLSCAPFHVTDVFEDKDDAHWAWSLMFKQICDNHAPIKRI